MKQEDFSAMDWRIDLCPERQVIEEYEELNGRFKKFSLDSLKMLNEISNDQLVRFIVYAYHKNSPFVKKITEVKQRKTQALLQAGVDLKLTEAQEILEGTNRKIADMIFAFLIGENNHKFSALIMQMDAYYRMNYNLAYSEGKQGKGDIEAITKLAENIENLSHDVFHGEKELSNFVQGSYILTPEQYAHKPKV